MKKIQAAVIICSAMIAATALSGCNNTDTSKNYGEMRGLTAKELIADMKTGWNLGNSLDSLGGSETSWGNPVTTKEMIDTVSAGGFDILRVPVTWGEHMGDAPDYTVDPEFMDRVEEVVGYGIDNDMYVILEIHHEPDLWLLPDSEHMSEVEPKFTALWKQIAERFKPYGDKLVFESMNEARVKGTPHEWTGGNEDERSCVNKLNKIFVDTVKAAGGNNEKRLLLITTHAQAVTESALSGLELIDDEYVGAAVHAYIPYSFAYHSGESYETFEWDGHENGSVDYVFDLIDKYIVGKGVPVMITEYGAEFKMTDSGGYNTPEICKWADYFLGKAKELDIPCVIWDNNILNASKIPFGLFNRKDCTWNCPDILEAIMNVYNK